MAEKERGEVPTGWLVGLGLLILAVGGGLAYWIWDRSKALKLSHLGSGKMMADGSEQILFEFICTEPFTFDGWVNMKNMQAGDKVTLTQNVKLGVNKEYGEYDSRPYLGVQEKPMVFIRPKNAIYGMKVILQQTEGVFREFEWEFYKGVTS